MNFYVPDRTDTDLGLLSHELTHFIEKWNSGKYDTFAKFLLEKYAEKGQDVEAMLVRKMAELGTEDVNKAYSELVADACESLLLDSNATNVLAELASKDKGLVAKIKRFFEDILNKLRKYYKGLEPQSAEGRLTRKLARECEEIYRMFEDALKGAVENFKGAEVGKAQGKDVQMQRKSDKFAEYDKPITLEDVKLLRSIVTSHNGERVSINDFTAEDIEKAQKWAYKFYKELGVKSPFFRAWFGDWRAESQEDVKVVDKKGEQRNSSVNNKDTNWNIIVSRQVSKETNHHSGDSVKNAIKYLPYIVDITENAVLFDTVISSKENPLSLMYHTMYAYTEAMGYPALLKLKVEELINEKDGSPIRRDYILQNIKEESISIGKRFSKAHLHEKDSSTVSISDLFNLVKTYDPEFKPKPVHEALLNDDGTPKILYHGTSERFTEFSYEELSPVEGSFFFAENYEDAAGYSGTDNVMEVYVSLRNPVNYDDMPLEIYKLKTKKAQVEALKKLGYDGWYADMDSDGWGEISAFYPEQIKSATDNIGTFSRYDSDIQFQAKKKPKKVYATEIEKGVFRYNGVIYDTNRIRTDLLDNYTEKEYNKYAWAVVNGIIEPTDWAEFQKELAVRQIGSHDKKLNVIRIPYTLTTFYFRGGFANPVIDAVYKGVEGYEEYLTAEDYPKIEKEIRK